VEALVSEQIPEPVTPLAAGAAATHEMFLTLVGGGFTEQQALYIIAQILAAGKPPEQAG
jgi:hypothetical protein